MFKSIFVISNMAICKSIVKFVVSLITLIKKNAQPLKNIYNLINKKIKKERRRGFLTIGSGVFFPKGNFFFFWVGP